MDQVTELLLELGDAAANDNRAAVHALMASTDREVPDVPDEQEPGVRRVLVHSTGFRLSPYADVAPAGESVSGPSRKLWHSSPGSSGR